MLGMMSFWDVIANSFSNFIGGLSNARADLFDFAFFGCLSVFSSFAFFAAWL